MPTLCDLCSLVVVLQHDGRLDLVLEHLGLFVGEDSVDVCEPRQLMGQLLPSWRRASDASAAVPSRPFQTASVPAGICGLRWNLTSAKADWHADSCFGE